MTRAEVLPREPTRSVASLTGSWPDAALAIAVGSVQVVGTFLAGRHATSTPFDPFAWVLLIVGPAALVGRRRFPVGVLVVNLVCMALYSGLGYPRGPVFLALIVAFFTAVVAGHRLVGFVSVAVGWVASQWLGSWFGRADAPSWVSAGAAGAWLLVLLCAAEFVRVRRDRAIEAARMREEEARRRASEERLTIARELHDVLAHNVSMINIQASVALHLFDEQAAPLPTEVREALAIIKDASKDALVEMRSILDILRRPDDADATRAPVPGVDQVPALVARTVAAGLPVHLEVVGNERPLDVGADLTAFRVVQEGLTNAVRHAEATTASVRLEYRVDAVLIDITDDGRGARVGGGRPSAPGNGLSGMRERVAALGGDLEVGDRAAPDRGFHVHARLPTAASTNEVPTSPVGPRPMTPTVR